MLEFTLYVEPRKLPTSDCWQSFPIRCYMCNLNAWVYPRVHLDFFKSIYAIYLNHSTWRKVPLPHHCRFIMDTWYVSTWFFWQSGKKRILYCQMHCHSLQQGSDPRLFWSILIPQSYITKASYLKKNLIVVDGILLASSALFPALQQQYRIIKWFHCWTLWEIQRWWTLFCKHIFCICANDLLNSSRVLFWIGQLKGREILQSSWGKIL